MTNDTSLTVLQKCGISEHTIRSLKAKGLIVPEKIEPTEEPLRSPSEEWFYSVADKYTPSLTKTESEIFRKHPYLLSLEILKAVDILFEVSAILYEALEKVKTDLSKEEALAALLSILRIFHGCLDHNYLKYDRHLEYHEYEISPVGYYWHELRRICVKASRNIGVQDPEMWAKEKMLEVISGPRRFILSSEYAICCNEVSKQLKIGKNVSDISAGDIKVKLEKENPDLIKLVIKYSEYFYRKPKEFIRDCITARSMDPYERIMKQKQKSIIAIERIKSNLSKKDAHEFERVVEIIEDFLAVQELEGTMAYGNKRGIKNNIFDVLIVGFEQMKDMVTTNVNLVKKMERGNIQSMTSVKGPPLSFVALRKIVSEKEDAFNDNVTKLYREEMRRWK